MSELGLLQEDYISPIQTLTGPILEEADSSINFYC